MLRGDPVELQRRFLVCFRSQDLEGLMELYEDDAVFVGQSGEAAAGKDAVREALSSLLALPGVEFDYHPTFVSHAGDSALMHARWSLDAQGPDGVPIALSGVTIEVARQGDCGWRYLFDSPFGVVGTSVTAGAGGDE